MRVAHYVEQWLWLSAGFVAAHVAASRHPALVVSREEWANLDAFPHRPRRSLHRLRAATPEPWKHRVLRAQLEVTVRAHRIDLVHVHFGYAAADVVAVTGGERPYVLSLHGHDVTGLLHGDPDRYRRVVPAVDAVVVPSRFLAAAASRAGFADDVLHVIPAGVDIEFFSPTPLPDGAPIVAFVGRLVEKKGLDVLLDAWPHVTARFPDARLAVLGSGPQAALLPRDDPTVRHIPPDPSRRHEQVRELLRRSRVVVSPSRTATDGDSESLLLVNLEAAASGRPVVSTRHGGIPEYVDDGRTGLLVDEADAEQLAVAVIRVLGDPALAASLAATAVRAAARWDSRRCTARVDDLYEALAPRGAK